MSPGETVAGFIGAIERKDIDAAVAMTSDDISYENVPIRPIVGHEALAKALEGFLGPASAVDWQVNAQWEVGSMVINERLDRFDLGEGWLELPVAGVFEVNDDGKITLWRDYFDMATYQNQFAKLTGS